MPTLEFWIQLENRPWDASPHNIDRVSGQNMKDATGRDAVQVTLSSPPGAAAPKTRKVTMYNPLRDGDGNAKDALILRRYKPPVQAGQSDAWTVPDDRKVNPWDLNEQDPTDAGTMGTIPGPVIECNVGDAVNIHFRNSDLRARTIVKTQQVCFDLPFGGRFCFPLPTVTREPIEIEKRVHSLHPHGFVFRSTSDGAYPLSPPDPSQPVPPAEQAAWSEVPGFSGSLKKGDRVPPGGTFIYRWNTIGWPSTAGVWLYHDHSICDMENVELGAIGIIVIHNPADTLQEVDIRDRSDPMNPDPAFLPGGNSNGLPVHLQCFPLPGLDQALLPHDLEGLGLAAGGLHGHAAAARTGNLLDVALDAARHGGAMHKHGGTAPDFARLIRRGDLLVELDDKLGLLHRICFPRYLAPPSKALYLQLFHTLNGVAGMIINGRTFLGNTPTMIGGRDTRMRFGVVGMGSDVHTFHIHGHRWILPGPQGNTPAAIQSSPQVQAVSQFEDTRIFGAANSFVFTIDGKSGSFMRAGGPAADDSLGEWHMHCHVLSHMMAGMMGSLLIVRGGEIALPLPKGVPCGHEAMPMPDMPGDTTPTAVTLNIAGFAFQTGIKVKVGGTVTFKNNDGDDHSVLWDTAGSPANVPVMGPGASSAPVVMPSAKTFNFHCGVHPSMTGSVQVLP